MNRLFLAAARSRRLVLGTALVAGLALAIAAGGDEVVAEAHATELVRVQATQEPKATPPAASDAESRGDTSVDAEISIGEKGVTIKRRAGRARDRDREVVIGDHEFDSFEEFVEKAPWLAGLVFMVTALVFIVPLLIIILIVWYKMRSNRLRNETMLKLAERGVVTPAVAIDTVAATPAATALENHPATAPLYEQAKLVRKRAAWSDLRKGIILGAVGLGLTFWSMLDDGTANGFGLILLFVGIGYGVLWHFEERQGARIETRSSDPRGGG